MIVLHCVDLVAGLRKDLLFSLNGRRRWFRQQIVLDWRWHLYDPIDFLIVVSISFQASRRCKKFAVENEKEANPKKEAKESSFIPRVYGVKLNGDKFAPKKQKQNVMLHGSYLVN